MNEETTTGIVTFMFTDIEGSTSLWESYPQQMGAALRRHDELVRASIDGAGGRVFATGGDGFGAMFTSADAAVDAALDMQRGLLAEVWPDPLELRVRVGLHTGDAVVERGGDFFGPHVNRAARLTSAAQGGQTIMSAPTADAVTRETLIDLGRVHLRGIIEPVHVFGIATADVPWVDRPLRSARPLEGNLPRLQTETVGDLAGLVGQIGSTSARTVTLTGSGGVGKTRAAIEIGWRRVDEFADGVWFIDFGAIADAAAVPGLAAATLGLASQAGSAFDDLVIEWCRDRRLLLVVDNCEHVLAPVTRLVSRIVAECSMVSILATSREPLGVPGEQVIRIPSLHGNDAVELFLLRAAAAESSFDPAQADRDVIAAICARVDGIPLAIELAAARTTSLTPTEILDNLDDRFRLLRRRGGGGLERHQTLRATMTWSYQLLPRGERDFFDRLSAFRGGFDLDAAEAIGHASGVDSDCDDVIDLLGNLVAKSMVTAERTERGTRYRLLDTLRQYGEEQLGAGGSTASVRDRHLAHYTTLAEQLFARWESPDQLLARASYRQNWDNFRAAHAWSCATLDLQRSQSIVLNTAAYAQQGLLTEHAEWCTHTLSLVSSPGGLTARVLGIASAWALAEGRLDDGVDLARRGLELADDPNALGTCRVSLMYGLMLSGQSEQAPAALSDVQDTVEGHARPFVRWLAARSLWDVSVGQPSAPEFLKQFVTISEQIGGPMYLFGARYAQSRFFTDDDVDVDYAIRLLDDAVEAAEQVGERKALMSALSLKAIAMAKANHPNTDDQIAESISVSVSEHAWGPVVRALTAFVVHRMSQSSFDDAAIVVGFLDSDAVHVAEDDALRQRSIATVEQSSRFIECREIGRAMSRDDVVAFTLDRLRATT